MVTSVLSKLVHGFALSILLKDLNSTQSFVVQSQQRPVPL